MNKEAKILINSGYATGVPEAFDFKPKRGEIFVTIARAGSVFLPITKVDPYEDTLEGRRQLDAGINFFLFEETKIYEQAVKNINTYENGIRQLGIDRFKYCIEHWDEDKGIFKSTTIKWDKKIKWKN